MIAGKSGEIMAQLREGAHVALRDGAGDACNACSLPLTPGLFASSPQRACAKSLCRGDSPEHLALDGRANTMTEQMLSGSASRLSHHLVSVCSCSHQVLPHDELLSPVIVCKLLTTMTHISYGLLSEQHRTVSSQVIERHQLLRRIYGDPAAILSANP
jgi:hypothetical protein